LQGVDTRKNHLVGDHIARSSFEPSVLSIEPFGHIRVHLLIIRLKSHGLQDRPMHAKLKTGISTHISHSFNEWLIPTPGFVWNRSLSGAQSHVLLLYHILTHDHPTQGVAIVFCLDSEGELDTDIDITGHLDDLGQLDRLLSSGL
jgi:hypothetical protein